MHTCTQTLKSKGGLAHFSIVEFYTKEARNEFLDMVKFKKDMLICHGQIQVGRAQIPKYQREADQPFRCAIAVYAQIAGRQQRYKPIWKLYGNLAWRGMDSHCGTSRARQNTDHNPRPRGGPRSLHCKLWGCMGQVGPATWSTSQTGCLQSPRPLYNHHQGHHPGESRRV